MQRLEITSGKCVPIYRGWACVWPSLFLMGEFAKKISLCDCDTPLVPLSPGFREDIPLDKSGGHSSNVGWGHHVVVIYPRWPVGQRVSEEGDLLDNGCSFGQHTVSGRMTLPGPPCFVWSGGDTIPTTLFSTVPIIAWGGLSLIPFSYQSRRHSLLSCGTRDSTNTKTLNIIPFLFSYGFRTPDPFKLRVSDLIIPFTTNQRIILWRIPTLHRIVVAIFLKSLEVS